MTQLLEPASALGGLDPVTLDVLHPNEIAFYKKEGYLLLPGLLDASAAEELRAEVMEIMDQIGLPLTKLQQTSQYLAGSKLDRLVNSARLRGLAGQLMGGPSSVYLPFTAVKSAEGGGRFHFHQDNQYTRFDGPGINLWTALNPMSPENGCLQVVPRSHLRGDLRAIASGDGDQHRKIDWEPEDFLPIRMHAGDCIAFSRLTVHGSGANTSSEHRVAYALQFHRDDVSAVWDDQPPRLLKGSGRWSTGPVQEIVRPKPGKVDGH